jgi:hypothetical protein
LLRVFGKDRSKIKKKSVFDEFKDHSDLQNLRGNMDNDLDIDFRFDGPTASFDIGTCTASIFEVLITQALLRSKCDPVGNELEEGAVEYVADEISNDMYDQFLELVDEMMSIIDEQDKDVFNWD